MLWGLILLSGIFFLPESPRHLLGRGRVDEARRVVAELASAREDDPVVLETIEELQFGINAENEGGKATWAECFSTRNMLWKRTMNGMMLQFIQQLNGQNFYCKLDVLEVEAVVLTFHDRLLRADVLPELRRHAQPVRRADHSRRCFRRWHPPCSILH